jgi:hypothetical protein
VSRWLVGFGCIVVQTACGMPLWNPPNQPPVSSRVVLPPRDTVPTADRPAIWDAVLRFYRSGRVLTEADRAALVHARIGVEPRGSTSEPAPVVLSTMRRAMPYDSVKPASFDSTWLRAVTDRHLVAGLCAADRLTSCQDSVLTTYLALDDPVVWDGKVALNPALCKRRDVFVDHQSASARLTNASGEWRVVAYDLGLHATSSCSLVRKSRD